MHKVLTNPAYAGAYAFGKTRARALCRRAGPPRKRTRRLHAEECEVLIWDHHPGFVDRATFERTRRGSRPTAARARTSPVAPSARARRSCKASPSAGAARASSRIHYQGRPWSQEPRLSLPRAATWRDRGSWCLASAAGESTQAVAAALLEALTPAGVKAALARRRRARGRPRRGACAVAAAGRTRAL